MLNNTRKQPPISQEEQDLINLEGRRSAAESALMATSNANKVLEAKIALGEENLLKQKIRLSQYQEEILLTNNDLLEVKNLIEKESILLDNFKNDTENIRKDFENFKVELQKEKESLKFEKIEFINDCNKKKANKVNELQALENQKEETFSELKNAETTIDNLNRFEIISVSKIKELEESISKFKFSEEGLNTAIISKKSLIANFNTEIENKNFIIKNLDFDIVSFKNNIKEIDDLIEDKKLELKSLETQAFSILQREDMLKNNLLVLKSKEDLLDSKEEFIKSQFNRAGINWEQ